MKTMIHSYLFFRCRLFSGGLVKSFRKNISDLFSSCIYIYIFNRHIYFPAQLVGGFALSDLLDKQWSQVGVVPSPPQYVPSFFKFYGRSFARVLSFCSINILYPLNEWLSKWLSITCNLHGAQGGSLNHSEKTSLISHLINTSF